MIFLLPEPLDRTQFMRLSRPSSDPSSFVLDPVFNLKDRILRGFQQRLRRPDDALVVSRRHRASVGDVDRMARAVAAQLEEVLQATDPELARQGGALVALAAPNGPGFLAGWLAIRQRRCAALLCDWQTPAAEQRRIARALGVSARVECRRTWPRGPDDFTVAPVAGRGGEPATVSPEIAAVKLTSGSTGCPRGILTPTDALVADDAALAATMELQPDERILAAIPMSHSYGLSSVVLPALMRRSVLVVPPQGQGPLDPLAVARACGVTFLPTVPAFLQALLRMAEPPRLPDALGRVISAGALLPIDTAVAFRETYDRPVHVFYGASECGGIAFDRTGTAGERGTAGTPVEGVRISLAPLEGVPEEDGREGCRDADGDSDGDADRGACRGAVVVESPAVAEGYLPDPDPCLGNGRFRTRDLAAFRDGELVLEGRLDDLINVRGRKINPREVEAVLGRLSGVQEVVVLGVTPPGRSETVVRSFLVGKPGEVTRASAQAWCRQHLAQYKVPRSIVLLDEIPRTERGKLDRAALLALAPAAEPSDRG